MPENTYGQPWSRQYRGLLVFLLDQSASMQDKRMIGGKTYTNGQMATATLNDLIYTIIKNTPVDPVTAQLKDYCDILVLGYGDQIVPLVHAGNGLPISISEIAIHPRGENTVLAERFDSASNRVVQIKEKRPYWIVEQSEGRYTEMALALQATFRAVQTWLGIEPHMDSFPPIIINISDGAHNGTGDPVVEARKICNLYTNDGYVLLFNCHLTSHGQQRIVFPKTEQEVSSQITDPKEQKWAVQLFNMSSLIPRTMVQNAQEVRRVGLEYGTHGFLYNASPGDLMEFLTWGTNRDEKF